MMPEENKPEDGQIWPPPPIVPTGTDGTGLERGLEYSGPPPRHGCLTVWVGIALVAHALSIGLYSLSYQRIHERIPAVTPAVAGLLIALAAASIACVFALLRWRRWGFYGIVTLSILTLILNLYIGLAPGRAFSGLIGIALLYWVLNMGGKNSAWRYLK